MHSSPCRLAGKAISNTPYRNNRTRLTPADINKGAEKPLLLLFKGRQNCSQTRLFVSSTSRRYLTAEVNGCAMPAAYIQSITELSCPKALRCMFHCLSSPFSSPLLSPCLEQIRFEKIHYLTYNLSTFIFSSL